MRVNRYNGASPFAMKNRAFEAPDAALMERDVSFRIQGTIAFTDTPPKVFDQISLADVHINLDRNKDKETQGYQNWAKWNLTGTETFNKISLPYGPRLLELWFSGVKWLFICEDKLRMQHKCSFVYPSKTWAMEAYDADDIKWAEVLPLNST